LANLLRPYQEAAINQALEALRDGKKRILISMPQGTGKLFTICWLLLEYVKFKKGIYKSKILFICDRNVMVEQVLLILEDIFEDSNIAIHGDEEQEDPLDQIVRSFNERWFQGWEATPEEQKVKFVNIAQGMQAHPDFKQKYAENPDVQNREIAFRKIFDDVMSKQRKTELDLYRLISKDDAFRIALQDTLKRMLNL
jgi:hypothetical protein